MPGPPPGYRGAKLGKLHHERLHGSEGCLLLGPPADYIQHPLIPGEQPEPSFCARLGRADPLEGGLVVSGGIGVSPLFEGNKGGLFGVLHCLDGFTRAGEVMGDDLGRFVVARNQGPAKLVMEGLPFPRRDLQVGHPLHLLMAEAVAAMAFVEYALVR